MVPSRRELRERLDHLHEAIDTRRVVRLDYAGPSGGATRRDVEPLCLAFWGQSWTLGGWCRLREDFRNFRLDRMAGVEVLAEVAADDPARGLRAFLKSAGATRLALVCLVVAPEGVEAVNKAHPDVPIWTAAIDRELDENAYIRPGLGDAGHRVFGT